MSNPTTITLETEQGEDLLSCLRKFIDRRPQWDQDKVIEAGISLFLLQNNPDLDFEDRDVCTKRYLKLVCTDYDSSEQYFDKNNSVAENEFYSQRFTF